MIGQESLLNKLNTIISDEKFPHFSILSGERGSGRKLVASRIAQKLSGHVITCGTKVDEVRDMISMVNKTADKVVVIMSDIDNMSTSAENALLKITEEPPKNAWFIMTMVDVFFVPSTIISRATIFKMDKYTPDELMDFSAQCSKHLTPEEVDIIGNVCNTPGDVQSLINIGVIEFWEYVIKVVDHIDSVSTANSFKIAQKIALKQNAEGYELKLFWRTFMLICADRMKSVVDEDRAKYVNWVKVTSRYMQVVRVRGVNLQMLFDSWVIDIRGE